MTIFTYYTLSSHLLHLFIWVVCEAHYTVMEHFLIEDLALLQLFKTGSLELYV